MPLACIIVLRLLGVVPQLLRLRCHGLSGRTELFYYEKVLHVVDYSFIQANVVLDEADGI